MNNIRRAFLALGMALGAAAAVQAQDFPSRPIKLVIPFSPGGASDVLARMVADELGTRLGQPVIPDNRPGGSTAVAASFVARSRADGYTLLFSTPTHSINAATSTEKLPYDPVGDFDFIGKVGHIGFIVLANPQLKVKDMHGLVAAMRSQPGKLQYGSPGTNSQGHLWTESFLRLAKVEALHVPYKGENQALLDLLGGQLSLLACTFSTCAQHIGQPNVTALAVTTPARFAGAPQLPTMSESGYRNMDLVWYGFLAAPKGTPAPVVQKISAALNETLADEKFKKRLLANGIEPEVRSSPAATRALVEEEVQRWRAATASK
jgi:tripartite-type tricarboxylate transporter receptor subunit TctC